ncbi:MAG: glycosyltransferase, partial [Deltaproteobacteria bacterium]|nr:glycosyltransferase [Deltaproteobacteria bacterium]
FVSPYLSTQGPSDYPLALMEAMASGLCVVGSAVGGIPELIKDGANGVLVPPDDSAALGEAIAGLLIKSPERRKKLGLAARELMLSRFSVQMITEQHVEVYRQLLDAEGI